LVGVGKRYWKLDEPAMLLRSLLPFRRPHRSELWSLRGIDLQVADGEVLGIIGRNGAGKTTLLRLLAGVTRPTEGSVRVRGRVAPLIGVGVGFRPEMSGRENIYVNGMLLGMSKSQIDARFESIVAFSELADFIDTPVKFYSSGMYVRLGFSVAIHTEPQVLLVDEILAVGDLAFQMKCLERMREIKDSGATIVVVSHSMHAIRALCSRAAVISNGALDFVGDVDSAVARHHQVLSEDPRSVVHHAGGATQAVVGGTTLIDRQLLDEDGAVVTQIQAGMLLRVRVRFRFDIDVDDPVFGFMVLADNGTLAYNVHTPLLLEHRHFTAGATVEVEARVEVNLGAGSYRLVNLVASNDGREIHHYDHAGLVFFVEGSDPWASGVADLAGHISVDGVAIEDDRHFRMIDRT